MELSKFLILLLVMGVTAARQLPSGRRHYTLKVTEAGETFEETDDLDEDQNIEVIHVPAHNGLKEILFVIDHDQHLTMRLVAGSDRCLLSPALFSARDDSGELVDNTASDEAHALSEEQGAGPLTVQTEMHTLAMGDKVAASVRAQLAPAMLRLCDGRDIYRLEPMDDVMSVETEEEATKGVTLSRVARHESSGDLLPPNEVCPAGKYRSRCALDTTNCVYYVTMVRNFTCKQKLQFTNQATAAHKAQFKSYCMESANKHYLNRVLCCKKCCLGPSNVLPKCDKYVPQC